MGKMIDCNFKTAEPHYTKDMAERREVDLRMNLYRAVYRGDMDAAEDAANMMVMLNIDRTMIENARTEVRR